MAAGDLDSTSATCVLFSSGDTWAKALAHVSLVPFVAVLFAAAVAYRQR